MVVGQHFLAVPRGCLQFVNVVSPDHTHYFLLRNPIFLGIIFRGGGGVGGPDPMSPPLDQHMHIVIC